MIETVLYDHYRNNLSHKLFGDIKLINNMTESLVSVEDSIKSFRSIVIQSKSYVTPIVETMNILGRIPKPRAKNKEKMKKRANFVIDSWINDLTVPITIIENVLGFITESLNDLNNILNMATNYVFQKIKEGEDKVIDKIQEAADNSIIATIRKNSSRIINSITTIYQLIKITLRDTVGIITDGINNLIGNIAFQLCKTINNAVETEDPLSDDELVESINGILGSVIIQPLVSQIQNEIYGKVVKVLEPLDKISQRLGGILSWNFTMAL